MNDSAQHPVQALVWGIVDLVVAIFSLLFTLPSVILWAVYTGIRGGGQVNAEELKTIATIYFILVIVFGVIACLVALASIIIHGATAHLYQTKLEDGRFRSGETCRKISFPFAWASLGIAILITILACLALNGIF